MIKQIITVNDFVDKCLYIGYKFIHLIFNVNLKMTGKSKTATAFKNKAPFGVVCKRFQALGIHPNLDTTGSTKKQSKLGPGQYNPETFECAYKKYNVGGSSWKRKLDIEEFSKNLGFRNAHMLKDRQFRKSLCGPGTYEISEELFKPQCPTAIQNVGFSRQKRFWNPVKNNTPGPGTYGIPKACFKKQFSYLPSFEWDGFIDRFRSIQPPYVKPPNLYNPKDEGSIDTLLNKVVSKRGPYDLFTGPRDGSTIKNHFAPPAFKGPLTWFRTYPNELEILLTHPLKKGNGRFLKEKRFSKPTQRHLIDDVTQIVSDPDGPCPFTYDISSPRVEKQNKYAFNKSVVDARPPIKWKIYPGVGRYNPKHPSCARPKQQSWIFKSKCGRTEYKAVEYNSF